MTIYLAYGIIISAIAVSALAYLKTHRRIALISGLLAAPFGLLDSLFAVDYWNPHHVISPLFSIEGILFSFGNGVFVWLIAALPFWHRLQNSLQFKRVIGRAILYSAIALTVMLVFWGKGGGLTDMSLMKSTLVALFVISAIMLRQNPALLPLSLMGGLGFGLFYTIQLALLSVVDTDLLYVWKTDVREGLTVFGYPAEELTWATAYGVAWTTGIAHWCDVKITSGNKKN